MKKLEKYKKFVEFKVKHFVEIPTIRHDKAVPPLLDCLKSSSPLNVSPPWLLKFSSCPALPGWWHKNHSSPPWSQGRGHWDSRLRVRIELQPGQLCGFEFQPGQLFITNGTSHSFKVVVWLFLVELGKSAVCPCVEATDQVFIFPSNSYEESSPSVQHHVILEFGVTVLTCTRLYVWRLNTKFILFQLI